MESGTGFAQEVFKNADNVWVRTTLIEGMDKSLGDLLDHLDQLGVAEDSRSYAELDDRAWYDRLIASGFTVSKPTPIFPRLELPEDQAA